jgi:hypothetical protein
MYLRLQHEIQMLRCIFELAVPTNSFAGPYEIDEYPWLQSFWPSRTQKQFLRHIFLIILDGIVARQPWYFRELGYPQIFLSPCPLDASTFLIRTIRGEGNCLISHG